jgi:hypothetical protein
MGCVIPVNLLAQRHDSSDWVEIVLVLALLLGSSIIGLIKRSMQAGQQGSGPRGARPAPKAQPRPNWLQRLAQGLEQMQREASDRMSQANGPQPAIQDQSTFSEPAAPASQEAAQRRRHAERERRVREAVAAAGRGQTGILQPVGAAVETPAIPQSMVSSSERVTSEIAVDLAGPDALMKAVVLYEVLGQPLSLRDRSEQALWAE